jgi:hypothetical protein
MIVPPRNLSAKVLPLGSTCRCQPDRHTPEVLPERGPRARSMGFTRATIIARASRQPGDALPCRPCPALPPMPCPSLPCLTLHACV